MGAYSTYLETLKSFDEITRERKAQLAKISALRTSDVLVIAAAVGKPNTSIEVADLIPIADQLDALKGERLDVILETPGGSGETTEDIVRLLRKRHKQVSFIVPGIAKSAGTIMVMSGDEILMGATSSLGPIDAQVARDGKYFSAEAFLEGLENIKKETHRDQTLNRAYIPILQAISPGEIEAARNALKFGKKLAAKWLNAYKFVHWVNHTDGSPVTPEQREERAIKIADELGSHKKWMSHGRSIGIQDLRAMGIKITDYEEQTDLADAIRRYHILLRMTFDTNMFKVFETPTSQILRFNAPQAVPPSGQPNAAKRAEFVWKCPKCSNTLSIQVNFGTAGPLLPGFVSFPKTNKLKCPSCGTESDLTPIRMQLEAQTNQKIV